MQAFFDKAHHKLTHLFLRPIHVFVFHQVSDVYNPDTMWDCDWTQTENFKQNIKTLQKKYTFLSLQEAYERVRYDCLRLKNYAVLTSDDGWASLRNILPWLISQKIPVTLFLNPAYLLGEETPQKGEASLLKENEVKEFLQQGAGLLSIASHGWNHTFCSTLSLQGFVLSVKNSEAYLSQKKEYVPFFAYPCGRHIGEQDEFLIENHIVPVYCDGMKNYNDPNCIHRECIDEGYTK